MKRILLLLASAAALAYAQNPDGSSVSNSEGAPPYGWTIALKYSGSNLVATCYARANLTTGARSRTYVAISAVSKAAAAVVTSTGHGFQVGSQPQVTISGATGTGWTGINATWQAIVLDANTFSIPIDSTGFGTLGGTVVFTTTAARETMPEWAVQVLNYGAGTTLLWKGWIKGSTQLQAKCSDYNSTTVIVQ